MSVGIVHHENMARHAPPNTQADKRYERLSVF